MNYQLIVQFSELLIEDINCIAHLEEQLDEILIDAEVDGHDIGSNEINIFIHTNHPIASFEEIKAHLSQNIGLETIKIVYRDIHDDQYIPLWPVDLRDFKVN